MWQGFLSKEIILIIFYTILRGISSRAKYKCLKILKKSHFLQNSLGKVQYCVQKWVKKVRFCIDLSLGKVYI